MPGRVSVAITSRAAPHPKLRRRKNKLIARTTLTGGKSSAATLADDSGEAATRESARQHLPGLQDMESSNLKDPTSAMSDTEFAAYFDRLSAETQARNGVANRVCGECVACCTVMGVVELNKANYQPCAHECGKCGIYHSRPRTCRSWSCSWLLGHIEGDERRRPDRLGLIFNLERLAGKPITVAYEVWPRAGRESNNEYLLRKMSQTAPIILREYQTRKCDVITPDGQQRQRLRQSILDEWCQKPGADWSECGYFAQQ